MDQHLLDVYRVIGGLIAMGVVWVLVEVGVSVFLEWVRDELSVPDDKRVD